MSDAYPRLGLFIGGEWLRSAAGVHEVLNPSTEEVLAQLPRADAAALDQALIAADRAFRAWSRTPALDRGRILSRAAALMLEREEPIARAMVLEQGKTWSGARYEVRAAAESLQWHAEEARRLYGRVIPARQPGVRQYVLREPVGVVAAFTPWNFPALTPTRKLAAALAAGCTMVMKGAEESPGTLVLIAQCLADAGLPPGVFNLVFGVPHEVSEHLLASPLVKKMSITGSTPVGKQLGRLAMDRLVKPSMELGGHAPVLVFADADPEQVADALAPKKLLSSGQNCISPTRLYVQRPVYERLVERLASWTRAVRVGDPFREEVDMGPVSNRRRLEAVQRLVAGSCAAGARLAAGGGRLERRGFFHQMTLLRDVPDDAPAMQEEPFGPLLLATPFDTYDEVIARANALPYGLAGYAFTRSDRTAHAVSEDLQVGMLAINHLQVALAEAPFGGMKESGIGRENGMEGFEPYLQSKFVSHLPAG
jgi:succinate-semialdehyde dehydrogenase / glutarate-semialdehyde dehydrogenase